LANDAAFVLRPAAPRLRQVIDALLKRVASLDGWRPRPCPLDAAVSEEVDQGVVIKHGGDGRERIERVRQVTQLRQGAEQLQGAIYTAGRAIDRARATRS
jgi:hypothetical protein